MATKELFGRCPNCEAAIPEAQVLIQYETTEGRRQYAECPECLDVVHPV